jgi:hypothetical protein
MFLRFHEWRVERKRRMSEWHACRLPLFRKVTLIEPKFILFDWIVRRRFNNVWQYRAMTDQEYSDHIKKNEPTRVIVAFEKSSRSAKLAESRKP